MYLLDTNVVSESRKLGTNRIDPNVAAWIEAIDAAASYLSAMTIFELEKGVLQIERRDPRQGTMLRNWLTGSVLTHYHGRILPMSGDVAIRCATLHVPHPQSERDGWIAATALVHNLIVVTRNIADFEATGVTLVNPWVVCAAP